MASFHFYHTRKCRSYVNYLQLTGAESHLQSGQGREYFKNCKWCVLWPNKNKKNKRSIVYCLKWDREKGLLLNLQKQRHSCQWAVFGIAAQPYLFKWGRSERQPMDKWRCFWKTNTGPFSNWRQGKLWLCLYTLHRCVVHLTATGIIESHTFFIL